MSQQIPLDRRSAYDVEGLQHLQHEQHREDFDLQRQTTEEVQNERLKIRQIFRSVRRFMKFILFVQLIHEYSILERKLRKKKPNCVTQKNT